MRYFEQEQIVMREHVRETQRIKKQSVLAVATGNIVMTVITTAMSCIPYDAMQLTVGTTHLLAR